MSTDLDDIPPPEEGPKKKKRVPPPEDDLEDIEDLEEEEEDPPKRKRTRKKSSQKAVEPVEFTQDEISRAFQTRLAPNSSFRYWLCKGYQKLKRKVDADGVMLVDPTVPITRAAAVAEITLVMNQLLKEKVKRG
jgi:hypothetical protein